MTVQSTSYQLAANTWSPPQLFPKIDEQHLTFKALDRARQEAFHISSFKIQRDRYIIFSDVHKGNGSAVSDDFLHNSATYIHALDYYLNQDYRLVLNGDIEECWKFKCDDVAEAYEGTAFEAEANFAGQGPEFYLRTFGNHDNDWEDSQKVKRVLHPVLKQPVEVHPAITLGDKITIAHGHQGDLASDRIANLSRHVVRRWWKPVQQTLGLKWSENNARNHFVQSSREKFLYSWAVMRRQLLIAGHTHRALFHPHRSRLETDHYINLGSCIHLDGITGIEIDRGEIRLVQWTSTLKRHIFESADLGAMLARL